MGTRLTIVVAVAGHTFEPFNATAKEEAIESLTKTWEPFRKLSPDAGAYINEVYPTISVPMRFHLPITGTSF